MKPPIQYGIGRPQDAWTGESALAAFKALGDANAVTLHLAAIDVEVWAIKLYLMFPS